MPARDDTFTIEHRMLVRDVVPRRGQPYRHTCTLEVFNDVAHAFEDGDALTGDEIRERLDLPSSQVAVAMAFLKERGCIVTVHGRRHVRASTWIVEDALIEFHALEHASD